MRQYIFDHDELDAVLRLAWAYGFVDGLDADYSHFKSPKKVEERWTGWKTPVDLGKVLDGEPPFDHNYHDYKKRA